MQTVLIVLIYAMFFLSGAAALIYEVVWFRSLSLVFGGSHLAVTTVVSVFMGGLALGSYLIGKYASRFKRLLALYGLLELGIALAAGLFELLMKVYPDIYVPLARLSPESPLYLSLIRVLFGTLAMIIPTTLMGGTLPVLSDFVSKGRREIGRQLSFLYGLNTLGAVAGAVGAGFFLLSNYTMTESLLFPVFINIVIGCLAILLQNRSDILSRTETDRAEAVSEPDPGYEPDEIRKHSFSFRLVLIGIGISGFCALGYEVLWTKTLILMLGASVYGFVVVLAAFLVGIALGGGAYGVFQKMRKNAPEAKSPVRSFVGFGLVQIIIGLTALCATTFFFDLPELSLAVRHFIESAFHSKAFSSWQWANFAVAFFYMLVPAFFMGLAFPFAGRIHASARSGVARAVSEVMSVNTVGAILGASLSGYAFIYLVGIERSLQLLAMINIGFGLFLIAGGLNNRLLKAAAPAAVASAALFLAVNPNSLKSFDPRYFAALKSDRLDIFASEDKLDRALQNIKVLYYGEGAEAIVVSYQSKGLQTFSTNGWNEASTMFGDVQCQLTLGHLPMLLNDNPKKVLVVGLGSGMTLGAVSIHPSVKEITLVEIEPKVVGVAKTFAQYNHDVLDNPKLHIVFNDGRNFLLTTPEKFDVITADPIHPFFRGSGYLYTEEYFKLASEHLNPGGVLCQWLPLYHLTPENIKVIVRTFSESFKHTMIWQTFYDVELVGSNDPIIIDPGKLARRIADPMIFGDMSTIMMGSADDFLDFFVTGTAGVKAFVGVGIVNTDDNMYLEFSAPFSVNSTLQEGDNIGMILDARESIFPYLASPPDQAIGKLREKKWNEYQKIMPSVDKAHTLILKGKRTSPEFQDLAAELNERAASFPPWLSLRALI